MEEAIIATFTGLVCLEYGIRWITHQITENYDGKSSRLNMIECFNKIQNSNFQKTLNDQRFLIFIKDHKWKKILKFITTANP